MEPVNCPRCGKVFAKIREPLCPACMKEEEKIFDAVRDYIKQNPDKSVKEVAEACEVPVKRILQYVRDGRIDASGGMRDDITCSNCGKPILSGRMCEKCTIETNFKLQKMRGSDIKLTGKIFTRK
ncbi:MAG: flagellar protein [Defluviitaleaceae bacterium]|nr:flagellar protein [Defluviitaleaceae bacterium]